MVSLAGGGSDATPPPHHFPGGSRATGDEEGIDTDRPATRAGIGLNLRGLLMSEGSQMRGRSRRGRQQG